MRAPTRLLAGLIGGVTILVVLLAGVAPAAAHPLGNFTVNRYAGVEVSAGVVRVHYVLDLAEIPTFQARTALADDPDRYADDQVRSIVAEVDLEIDGRALQLRPVDRRLVQQPGEGGLPTTRLTVLLEAALPPGEGDDVRVARLTDTGGGGRIGWREIVVTAAGDAEILDSTVPSDDVSDALLRYPEDRLQSPLDVREAVFRFTPGTRPVAAAPLDSVTGPRRSGDSFTRLLDRQDLTPVVVVAMLAAAVAVGAGHALAPGHGKTVMAAYLVGTRGRPVDAVMLGLIVSAMHTTSVLLLGLVLYRVDQRVALDRIYPVLTLLAGIGVLIVGVWLASTRVTALRQGARRALVTHHTHDHDTSLVGAGVGHAALHHHADHGHDHHAMDDHDHHPHGDDDGRHHTGHRHGPGGHSHALPEGVAPLSKRGLLLLATAGGVVPSPSAVIVLVSAFTLGRVELGLALVGAFSVGLAAALTAVGLALVFGSRAVGARVNERLVRAIPVLGASALVVLGILLTARGVRGL